MEAAPSIGRDGAAVTTVDERFALHNVLFNPDSQRYITSLMLQGFEAHRDTPIMYNRFFGDGTKLRNKANDVKKKTARSAYDFTAVMEQARNEDPDAPPPADYNKPSSHFDFIAATLMWAVTDTQLLTNGAAFMMLWMYISERLRNAIREATPKGIQSVYFDGSTKLPFRVLPFEERFDRYLLGQLGPGRTTVVPSQLPPMCVCSEHLLYNAIANSKETAEHDNRDRRSTSTPVFSPRADPALPVHLRPDRSSVPGVPIRHTSS